MGRSNGEPITNPAPEPQHTSESSSPQEQLLKLIENLHDVGVLMTLNRTREYRLNSIPYIYHTRNFEPVVSEPKPGELRLPGDGHVKNVEKVARLHLAALTFHRAHRSDYADPIGLHDRAASFFDDLRERMRIAHERMEPLTPRQREESEAVEAWFSMSDDERQTVTADSFSWTPPHHDLGNVLKAVADWQALLEPNADFSRDVGFLDRQRYEGSEQAEAHMFGDFVDACRQKLGWSETHAAVVKALGREMILKTIYTNNFVGPDEDPRRAMITLGIIDQIASMLNASALRGVIGLINEYRVRVIKGDKLAFPDFNPDVFCGGFVLGRFEALDAGLGKEKGTSFNAYVAFLDEFRKASPEEFAKIMSVPVENIKGIGNFEQFLRDRMAMQQEAARVFWPPETRDANGRISFHHAFEGWSERQFQNLEKICKLYQERFWDPVFTARDFSANLAMLQRETNPSETHVPV